VEARRIGAMLEDRGPAEFRCRQDGMLRHLAGLAFETAGELNDALVSMRQAEGRFDTCAEGAATPPNGFGRDLMRVAGQLGFNEIVDSAGARYPDDVLPLPPGSGEVVVILERGFVAHLSEDAIHVPIFEREIEELESDIDGIARAATAITARLAANFADRGYWGRSRDDHPAIQVGQALSGAHILRLAWATSQAPERLVPPMRILAGDQVALLAQWGDLSALVPHELDEKRAAALARIVTRGLAKFLVARELQTKAEKQGGEVLGFVTGRLANLAGNELERADTRSWTLLPDEIQIGRLTLPAGSHSLWLEGVGSAGVGSGIEIGSVEVTPGRVTMINLRLWSDEALLPPFSPLGIATAEQ
jgi:hypothetical protein